VAGAIILTFGLWWLGRAEKAARQKGDGFALPGTQSKGLDDPTLRERTTVASEFDPAELPHGHHAITQPSVVTAILPLVVVLFVNLALSAFVLPSLDTRFLAEEKWGGTSLAAVGGVWAVVVALFAAIVALLALNYSRLPALKETFDTGANASVLPALSVASLVGFGAVIAALPAFALVNEWVMSIEGGPLVSLAIATNLLAALTGSASGGLTITLDALGEPYLRLATEQNIRPCCIGWRY
jgi:H+/gluconate symporter-like permease